jgi:hypothetical protein
VKIFIKLEIDLMVLVNFCDCYFIKLARWKTGNAIKYFGLYLKYLLHIPFKNCRSKHVVEGKAKGYI